MVGPTRSAGLLAYGAVKYPFFHSQLSLLGNGTVTRRAYFGSASVPDSSMATSASIGTSCRTHSASRSRTCCSATTLNGSGGQHLLDGHPGTSRRPVTMAPGETSLTTGESMWCAHRSALLVMSSGNSSICWRCTGDRPPNTALSFKVRCTGQPE